MSRTLSVWCALFALLLGCRAESVESGGTLHVHTLVNQAQELWVSVNGQAPERLSIEAEDFRPVLSPNGAWLAVEARLLSSLGVVRLFKRAGDRFVAAAQNVTASAWRTAGAREGFDPDRVDNPQAFVHGWQDGGQSLEIELRGMWGDQPLPQERLVRIRLDPES